MDFEQHSKKHDDYLACYDALGAAYESLMIIEHGWAKACNDYARLVKRYDQDWEEHFVYDADIAQKIYNLRDNEPKCSSPDCYEFASLKHYSQALCEGCAIDGAMEDVKARKEQALCR